MTRLAACMRSRALIAPGLCFSFPPKNAAKFIDRASIARDGKFLR